MSHRGYPPGSKVRFGSKVKYTVYSEIIVLLYRSFHFSFGNAVKVKYMYNFAPNYCLLRSYLSLNAKSQNAFYSFYFLTIKSSNQYLKLFSVISNVFFKVCAPKPDRSYVPVYMLSPPGFYFIDVVVMFYKLITSE